MWSASGMYVGIIQMSLSGSCLVPGSWRGKEWQLATAVSTLRSCVPHPHSSLLVAGFATDVLQAWWNITPPISYQVHFAWLQSSGPLQSQKFSSFIQLPGLRSGGRGTKDELPSDKACGPYAWTDGFSSASACQKCTSQAPLCPSHV